MATMSRFKRSGSAALEFVLVFPFMVILVFGIAEYSLFVNHFHYLQRAARDGARVGSSTLEGHEPTGALIRENAANHAISVLEANGIPCDEDCRVTAEWTPVFGEERWVVLTVEAPYQPITGLFPSIQTHSVARFSMLTQAQPLPAVE
jgi:Flp pilus assembly protein TadG